jgi:hypothetical protein
MNSARRRLARTIGFAVLLTCGAGVAGQEPSGRAPSPGWLQSINKASVVVESLAEQRARVTIRGQGNEKVVIEADTFNVSTTPQGLKIASDGLARMSWTNGTDQSWEVESMELNVPRDGAPSISAKRMTRVR